MPLAIVCGALFAGVIGILLERLVIRHLYGRPLDTIVATWGISLIASQGTLILLGPACPTFRRRLAAYRSALCPTRSIASFSWRSAAAILAGLYLLFNFTRFGVLARATIQVPHMAEALGVNTRLIYSLTFGIGAALAGATGGLYAPTMTLVPTMGGAVHHRSLRHRRDRRRGCFPRHRAGRRDPGLHPAAMTTWEGQLAGQIGLLVAVIIVIRVLPRGISGLILRERT